MKKVLLLILSACISLGLSAQTDSVVLSPTELWVQTLQHKLDSITSKVSKQRYSASYCIMDLTDDSVIYRYNAQRLMKPASTQKLFVATTALRNLSADYCFRTCLFVDGNLMTDSIGRRYLKGDLCIRGCFDPTIEASDIYRLSEKLSTLSIDSIDGKIIADNRVKMNVRRVKDVPKYFAETLYNDLVGRGMKFSSSSPYESSSAPLYRGWNLAAISTPINKVLNRMLKQSDNNYAECMLQNLCDMGRSTEWSYEACKDKVLQMVNEVGDSTTNYIIADGSGLSYSNKCTAELLTTLLRYDYHDEEIFPSIYDNLPIAGVDGTLSRRMKEAPLVNNVRAKTGTLNDTSTLAGYATASNGHILAFAIMVNNLGGLGIGKQLQNHICEVITN